jgi:hypothetical protein
METERRRWRIGNIPIAGSAVALMGALAACTSTTPGARPHDMSAEQHEAMAAREEAAAAEDRRHFDPGATEERRRCRNAGRVGGFICWSSTVNPTERHMRDAEEHRRRAAEHRAAAQALRDAEARACVGIAPEDRDMSPFNHKEDIARVEPLTTQRSVPNTTNPPILRGATVVFRAVPGLTPEWLQRTIDCHLARNAAMGYDASDMPYCPLMLKDVSATVTSTGDGLAVAVRSDDPEVAAEIWRRAQALAGG